MVASFSEWRRRASSASLASTPCEDLLARLAQRAGHLVEALGEIADLVVALAQDDAAEIAVGDVVDGLDQALERVGDGGARRQPDEQRQQEPTGRRAPR